MEIIKGDISEFNRVLYIYPTHAVLLPPPPTGARSKTINRLKNEENLKDNKTKGHLSEKSRKRLKNAINWLVLSSKSVRKWNRTKNTAFNSRISFITLTVPTTNHNISDESMKKKVLHAFLNNMVKNYGMKSYVWKIERNENGNIHFHITTDIFIDHSILRKVWNNVLSTFGILQEYTSKFEKMTYNEYKFVRQSQGEEDEEIIQRGYKYGTSTKWSNPNTTDIHNVRNVKNLAAYISNYMAKKEVDRSGINGRLWGCSHNLSNASNLKYEHLLHSDSQLNKDLNNDNIKWFPIMTNENGLNESKCIGDFFSWNLEQIGVDIKGRIFELIKDTVWRIRNADFNLMIE